MSTKANATKAAALGRGTALALKWVLAAERRLITRSGRYRAWVKAGLIVSNLMLVGGLVIASFWALVVVLPMVLIFAVLSHGSGIEYPNSDGYGSDGKYHPWFDEGE